MTGRTAGKIILALALLLTAAPPAFAQCGFNLQGDGIRGAGQALSAVLQGLDAGSGRSQSKPQGMFTGSDVSAGSAAQVAIRKATAEATTPQSLCEDLPYRGLFYGNLVTFDSVGEVQVKPGSPISMTYNADKTGAIESIVFSNRIADVGTRRKRAASSGKSCLDGSACLCGFYSCNHNLSRIHVEAYRGRCVADGSPTGSMITQTETYIPHKDPTAGDIKGPNYHKILKFQQPINVTAGEPICYRWINTGKGMTWAAINNATVFAKQNMKYPTGPFYSVKFNGGSNDVWRNDKGEPDSDRTPNLSFIYADGQHTGSRAYHYSQMAGLEAIGGSNVARQTFTPSDATRTVNALWVRVYTPQTGQGPLTATVRDASGAIIGQGSLDGSAIDACCLAPSGAVPASPGDPAAMDWVAIPLDDVVLEQGKSYSVDVSAPAGSVYYMKTSFESTTQIAGVPPVREAWSDGQAQYSTGNGFSPVCYWGSARSCHGSDTHSDWQMGFQVSRTTCP